MPSLDPSFINNILSQESCKYPFFVESGTYMGETIRSMEGLFEKLYTIEIKREYYDDAKNKYCGNKINFILGDSSSVLENLCRELKDNTIFFLDGHWSAGDTGRGKKDCPLMEEVMQINNNFEHQAILIIDDFRLFGKGPNKKNEICNWEDISKDALCNILKDRIEKVYHLPSASAENDRLVIHISRKD